MDMNEELAEYAKELGVDINITNLIDSHRHLRMEHSKTMEQRRKEVQDIFTRAQAGLNTEAAQAIAVCRKLFPEEDVSTVHARLVGEE